jgi:hypothetical protein
MTKEKEVIKKKDYCRAVKVKEWKICDRCGYFICSGSKVLKWSKNTYTHMVCNRENKR